MIVYFTGTGNSRYVAEALADRLDDEVICANDYIKRGEKGNFTSERPYVFVFPVYLDTMPEIFRKWLLDSSFNGTMDAYFVSTCASSATSVPNASRDVCREKKRLAFKGAAKVCMPQNYVAMFSLASEEKIAEYYRKAPEQIDVIAAYIKKRQTIETRMSVLPLYAVTNLVEKWYNTGFTKTEKFTATDACIGCGLCEKKCPVNAIELREGRPAWIKPICVHCMACINSCPSAAIEYGEGTVSKPRYICVKYKKDSAKSTKN